MSHNVLFKVPLTCINCGAPNEARAIDLYTSSFGQDPADTELSLGEVIDLDLIDFADGYFTLRRPSDDDISVIALELWGCDLCSRMQPARLQFERVSPGRWRLADARVVPMTSPVLDEVHFLSRKLEQYAPFPGDDLELVSELKSRFARQR